jgi:hypothetical protein
MVAVADATVEAAAVDPRMAGLYVLIRDAHGVVYDYVHLDHFAAGLRPGEHVRRGQVIGFVGNTGDAAGGATHLHFEVHVHGVPVPPKPYVDRWLLLAQKKARLLRRTVMRGTVRHGRHAQTLAVARGAIAPPPLAPFDPSLLAPGKPTSPVPSAKSWSGADATLPILVCLPLAFSFWARVRRRNRRALERRAELNPVLFRLQAWSPPATARRTDQGGRPTATFQERPVRSE